MQLIYTYTFTHPAWVHPGLVTFAHFQPLVNFRIDDIIISNFIRRTVGCRTMYSVKAPAVILYGLKGTRSSVVLVKYLVVTVLYVARNRAANSARPVPKYFHDSSIIPWAVVVLLS